MTLAVTGVESSPDSRLMASILARFRRRNHRAAAAKSNFPAEARTPSLRARLWAIRQPDSPFSMINGKSPKRFLSSLATIWVESPSPASITKRDLMAACLPRLLAPFGRSLSPLPLPWTSIGTRTCLVELEIPPECRKETQGTRRYAHQNCVDATTSGRPACYAPHPASHLRFCWPATAQER